MSQRASLAKSFAFAFAGIKRLLRGRNVRLELAFAALAAGLGCWLRLGLLPWMLIVVCCAGVLSAEAMNSALEVLADTLHPKKSPGIGLAKDLAAAAVLLWALAALCVGLALFVPLLLARSGP